MTDHLALFRGIGLGLFIQLVGWIVFLDVWRLVWIALPQ